MSVEKDLMAISTMCEGDNSHNSSHNEVTILQELATKKTTYELVLKELGGFGRFQIQIFILVSMFEMPAAWAMLLPLITHSLPRWTCSTNSTLNSSSADIFSNITYVTTNNTSLVQNMLCDSNDVVCTSLKFPGDDFTSIVSEWTLLCGEKTIPGIIMSIQMAGVLIGALLTGQLADIFGRRKSLFMAYVLLLVAWLISAFSVSWPMYAVLRFLVGALIGGVLVVNFVLPMEFVLAKWRTFCGCVGFWAIGFITLALWGYLVRDWRHLTIATSLSGIPLIFLWRWIPESPRWLYYNGQINEATAILTKMAEVNRRPMPDVSSLIDFFRKEKMERSQRRQLFSYWHLCSSLSLTVNSIALMYLWFVSSSVYYGMSLNVSNLSGNRYLNIFCSGLVEIPALIYLLLVNDRLGRRKTLFSLMIAASVFCFIILALDTLVGLKAIPILVTALSMMGKCAIAGAWAAVQVLSAECFPTVIRNIGIASCSMSARIGGVISPQLVLLGKIAAPVPFLVFGILTIVAAIVGCFIPEKKHRPLPDVLSDARMPLGYTHKNSVINTESCDDLEMEEISASTTIIPSSMLYAHRFS